MSHTYARLRGFGMSVVPLAPYCIRRIGDGLDDRISIEHGDQSAELDPRKPHALGTLSAVAEIEESDTDAAGWLVDFGPFTVTWPNHFSLASSEVSGAPFELWGERGSGIFIQGPFAPPVSEPQLVAPGQTIVGRGALGDAAWLEVQYASEESLDWSQRHYALPNGFVITAQAPSGDQASTIRAAERLASEMLDIAVD